MYVYIPAHLSLLVFAILLAAPQPSSANVPIPGAVARSAHFAQHRASMLARDLRRALHPIFVPRGQSLAADPTPTQGVYCVNTPVVALPPLNGPGANSTATRTASSTGATKTSAGAPSPTASSNFDLVESHSGNNFFDGWTFFTGGDPTNGAVTYVDQATAQSAGLAAVNSAGHAIMTVETTPTVASTRQSVRITTNSQYSDGLLAIMDSVHMPTGCGTWPAWWLNGPNWPAGGEIDVVEGVNTYTNNQATIHTNPGCTIPSSNSQVLGVSGTVVGGTNCAAAESSNEGCGMRSAQTNSFGAPFNAQGGGVYAMNWNSSGVYVWFFARSAVPGDITASAPIPNTWGVPMAFWPASGCSPFQFFSNISGIFDTTLCGDWAGNVWTDTGVPGQNESCAQTTGYSTCQAFVEAQGGQFNEAYWEVASVKFYKEKS